MQQDTITIKQSESQRMSCTKGHEWETKPFELPIGGITFPGVSDKTLCQRCWWEWLEAHCGEVPESS